MSVGARARAVAWLNVCALLVAGHACPAAAAITTTSDRFALANALLGTGSGFTVLDAFYSGDLEAAGLQDTGTGGIGAGILLTTGHSANAAGPSSNAASENNSRPGLTILEQLAGLPSNSSRDAAIVQLNLRAGSQVVGGTFDFVFGTEETPSTGFNDAFAVWMFHGDNRFEGIALLRDATAVTVNSASFSASSDNTSAYDRHGTPITASFAVLPNEQFRLYFAIADVGGGAGDSGIYLANMHALAVPEPGALVLLLGGLVVVAIQTGRRHLR